MRNIVLFLDDDLEDLEIIKNVTVLYKDVDCFYFSNSYSLIRFINENEAPSLIISDYHMPNIDGFCLLSYLQRSKRFSTIPVVILTGGISEGGKARLLRAGAQKVYSKPASQKGYAETIKESMHFMLRPQQKEITTA